MRNHQPSPTLFPTWTSLDVETRKKLLAEMETFFPEPRPSIGKTCEAIALELSAAVTLRQTWLSLRSSIERDAKQ